MADRLKKFLNILMILAGLTAAILIVLWLGRAYENKPDEGAPYSGTLLRYDGWQLLREGEAPVDVELPGYVGGCGGSAQIVNVLPRALESGATLVFESTNVYVVVRVDGEEIYRNLDESVTQPFSMWNYIRLSETQAEGRITIEFSGPDSYDVGILPGVYLGPRAEIQLLAENETRVNAQVCVSVLFFGIFVMLCALTAFSDIRYSADFLILGAFISMLGLSQWLQIVFPLAETGSWFMRQGIGRSLFGLLPPFYCYYNARRASEKAKRAYEVSFWIGIGFFFLVYLLRWFGSPVVWPSLRVMTYVVLEAIYGVCLYASLVLEKENSARYRLLLGISLASLMLGMGLESFTHIGYTVMRTVRPLVIGSLIFSLLQATAVLFYVFDHAEQQARIARELSESRVRLMMNQIKPHFIRSALGAVRTAIKQDPDKAYSLLKDFTDYVSFNLESMDSSEPISFAEELKHIRSYANVEQERYRPRIRVDYDIRADGFQVPPLSIQPFVENAVRHGVWPRSEGGTVLVSSEETAQAYVIRVEDDGVGYDVSDPPPAMRGHGIGIKNSVYRLEAQVNGNVKVDSEVGKGTCVTITIPKGKGGGK